MIYVDCTRGASEELLLAALIDAGADAGVLLQMLSLPADSLAITHDDRGGLTVSLHSAFNIPRQPDLRGLGEASRHLYDRALSRLSGTDASEEGPRIRLLLALCAAAFGLHSISKVHCSPLVLPAAEQEGTLLQTPPSSLARMCRGLPVAGVRAGAQVTAGAVSLLAAAADVWGSMPPMQIHAVGAGRSAGDGLLQVMIGIRLSSADETLDEEDSIAEEELVTIETNLDDLSPQTFDWVMERLFASGALDVYFQPIQMKKNRPAVLLSVLCGDPSRRACMDVLFEETTTLGVRSFTVRRHSLRREMLDVRTAFGPIPVKVAYHRGKVRSVMPEYDVCRSLARAGSIPLRQIQDAAVSEAWEMLRNTKTAAPSERGSG